VNLNFLDVIGYNLLAVFFMAINMLVVAGDEDEDKEKESKQEYTLLCDWIKQQLGDKVAKVQISKRLSSSPCVLVSGKFGWSANMER
jgi:HSP90 family molecular chaperone